MRILRIQEVSNKTGLSPSSIYKQVRLDEFPPSVKITKRASGWDEEAVDAWIAAKLGKSLTSHTLIGIQEKQIPQQKTALTDCKQEVDNNEYI